MKLRQILAGVKIQLCDFSFSNLFGLSIGEADGGPAMVINTGKSISVERKIFSIAHELGHLILHRHTYGTDYSNEYEQQEHEADIFAAAFLMPMNQFIEEWN
ncbi:MAG: ImmA/IrrE family metallo-endopeptidase, partial [Kiritimatiellae bacterium]|nr:ImmA/IrrE family metallo-endopeptidase [Kiritimatiellia bacterium]